jgi:hypothetical protein
VNAWASRQTTPGTVLALLSFLGILRVFAIPVAAVFYLICALLAPDWKFRRVFLGAEAIEGASALYFLIHFLATRRFF